MDVEYLVIGAGAAGCTLGTLLQRAGKDVLALELHDAQEKDKLCGGILGASSLAALESLFGNDALEELAPTYPPYKRNRSLGKEAVSHCAYAAIPRKRLDDWLLTRYVAAGGRIRDRMRVVSVDEDQRIARCRNLRMGTEHEIPYGTLVAADGAHSTVRRLITGRHQDTVLALEGVVASPCKDIVFSYDPKKQGYCWYVPTDAMANVGCMSYGDTAAECRAWLASFCEGMSVQPPRLRGALIPTGSDIALRSDKGTYFIGDAAGLASPIDGGGIHFAIVSAARLAQSLLIGGSYEESMASEAEGLARQAAKRAETYLLINLLIAGKGRALGSPLSK